MTCEWVEGNLSAYLDDALDPQARADVGSHIERCDRCQSLLNDYERDELLLRALPTALPDDRLRERIFDSPEYAALTRRLAGDVRPARSRALRALLPAAALIALALGGGIFARRAILHPGRLRQRRQDPHHYWRARLLRLSSRPRPAHDLRPRRRPLERA